MMMMPGKVAGLKTTTWGLERHLIPWQPPKADSLQL
jgi:hypothetical protein